MAAEPPEMIACPDCSPPCPLAGLFPEEERAWHGLIRSASFVPQQMIFEQGEAHGGCYLLCKGWALLRARTASGRRLVMGLAGRGELIGVGAFLNQERYNLSAQALTKVKARYLTCMACQRLLKEPSSLANGLIPLLARQVKQLQRQSRFFASGASVRERLAALVGELGQRYGRTLESGAQQIEPRLTYTLLGQMLDCHRATVNEEMTKLRRRGLVAREEGRIVILDEAGLGQLAQSVF